jgi:hypothetical protein
MAPSKLQISPENAKNYPCLFFCSPKLLQILSSVYCLLPPPLVCPGGGETAGRAGGGGVQQPQQQQEVGVNRRHRGRASLEQFRTTESIAWASGNTYSLDITLRVTDVTKRQMLTTVLLNCITSCFQNVNFHKSLN